jgi:hypothetical protein
MGAGNPAVGGSAAAACAPNDATLKNATRAHPATLPTREFLACRSREVNARGPRGELRIECSRERCAKRLLVCGRRRLTLVAEAGRSASPAKLGRRRGFCAARGRPRREQLEILEDSREYPAEKAVACPGPTE